MDLQHTNRALTLAAQPCSRGEKKGTVASISPWSWSAISDLIGSHGRSTKLSISTKLSAHQRMLLFIKCVTRISRLHLMLHAHKPHSTQKVRNIRGAFQRTKSRARKFPRSFLKDSALGRFVTIELWTCNAYGALPSQ